MPVLNLGDGERAAFAMPAADRVPDHRLRLANRTLHAAYLALTRTRSLLAIDHCDHLIARVLLVRKRARRRLCERGIEFIRPHSSTGMRISRGIFLPASICCVTQNASDRSRSSSDRPTMQAT